ncbi:hypothetical protein ACO22_04595 [Paracoccidioides brasiliensis]|uniref:Major facilitator superfamily (MFS) profile domain-containing protein n=1 Tax=Paracoccidioides brasiliensis TaxID=121759 RepID=A0A1D2JCR8_PARBR|nr:hypothetical protein ACO22_04595 [Paracoccidioides brasiliensis]
MFVRASGSLAWVSGGQPSLPYRFVSDICFEEVSWGAITGLIAIAKEAKQVYILRALLGVCESSAWPGTVTLFSKAFPYPSNMDCLDPVSLSSTPSTPPLETNSVPHITNTMEGHRGIAGWRWLFILNAIITVVWGCAGVFMLPDLPNKPNPRAVWFTKDHAELSMERLVCHGHGEPKRTTWAGVSRTFSSWVVYFIAALYIATVLGTYGYVYFGLFLKSQKNADGSPRWSVSQVNATAIGGSVINVVSVWVWVLLSDFMETRWTLIVAQAVLGTIPCIIMSIWTSHPTKIAVSAAYASYFISCICLGTAPLIFSWLSDITPQDPEARSLIVGVSVAGYYSISAWSQVLVWPASQMPHYKYGW